MTTELEEERDFLLRSLEDLEAERAAGDISDADYAALRDEYTARAADVLRALSDGPGRDFASGGDAIPHRGRRVVAAAAVVAVAVLLGVLVASRSGERLPGQPSSGTVEAGPAEQVNQARTLVAEGKAGEALRLYQRVLDDDPHNAAALADIGWLLHQSGRPEDALAYLDRAVAADPRYADAHFFRGVVLWKAKGDAVAGADELRLALANDPSPELRETASAFLREAEAAAGGAAGPQPPG